MDEDIKKALDGELDDQGLKDLESKLSDEGKRILKEALAFKAKKRDEEEKAKKASEIADAEEKRVADLKAEADRIENELSHSKEQMSQFRQEQILKAKNKFFSDYNIPAEQQEEYSKKFERFDSGKVDPDLIYDDFVSVYAALNKDALLKSQKDIEEMKKNAELHNAGEAGSNSSAPTGEQPKKFSDEAMALSQKAGITPEAAERQLKDGMHRVL